MATSNAWYWWVVALLVIVGVVLVGQISSEGGAKLRAGGKAAQGRVLEARQTGTWVGNNPELELLLAVSAEGMAEREVRLRVVVPQVQLAGVQPGASLRLRVAGDAADKIVLDEDWAR